MQGLVNWPPTASRIALWDLNEHGYAHFRQKDVEPTRGKCPVGEISRFAVKSADCRDDGG